MVHGPNHWKHTFTWLVMAWTWEESVTFFLTHNIDYKWWYTFSRLPSRGVKIAKLWLLLHCRLITPWYMDFYLRYFKGKTIAFRKSFPMTYHFGKLILILLLNILTLGSLIINLIFDHSVDLTIVFQIFKWAMWSIFNT